MKAPFITGLDKRHLQGSADFNRPAVDTSALLKAGLLATGISVALTSAAVAAALPSSIDADLIRGFAVDAEAVRSEPPIASAKASPAVVPATEKTSVARVMAPAAQAAAPKVKVETPAAPTVTKTQTDSGGAPTAMDPKVILGFAQPAVLATPRPQGGSGNDSAVQAPAAGASAVASLNEPPMPKAEAASPAPAATQQGAETKGTRGALDPQVIRDFAKPKVEAPSAATERANSPSANSTSPALLTTDSSDMLAQSSGLKPMPQPDLERIRAIFAPEM